MPFSTILPRPAIYSLAAVLMAGTALPAYALDGNAFAAKFAEYNSTYDTTLEYAAVVTDGDTVTLTETHFTIPGEPGFDAGDMVFSGVEETGDGGYYAETLEIEDVDHTNDGARITVNDILFEGMTIPADPTGTGIDSIMLYETFSAGPIHIAVDGKDVFSLESITANMSKMSGDAGIEASMEANGLWADVTQLKDEDGEAQLVRLGYKEVTGNISMNGRWEAEPGRVYLEEYVLTLDDVGTLTLALDISGYTLEAIRSMEAAGQDAAAKSGDVESFQDVKASMQEVMKGFTFASASIRFDDDSLTGRILEEAGKEKNMTGEQMGQTIKALIPLMASQLGSPALQKQLTAAANAYFDDPGNLTIAAHPETAVPFPQIMSTGMSDPRGLIDLLDVKITAND